MLLRQHEVNTHEISTRKYSMLQNYWIVVLLHWLNYERLLNIEACKLSRSSGGAGAGSGAIKLTSLGCGWKRSLRPLLAFLSTFFCTAQFGRARMYRETAVKQGMGAISTRHSRAIVLVWMIFGVPH